VEDRGDLVAFFACLYLAALRPGEALRLRDIDCELPDGDGRWGQLTLVGASSRGGVNWADDGEVQDHRGLKHRPEETVRHVPIPPELVTILREHLAEFGTAADGRLFRGRDDRPLSGHYGKVWRAARRTALSLAEAASPLAGRPYDLRHGGVSPSRSCFGSTPSAWTVRLTRSIGVSTRPLASPLPRRPKETGEAALRLCDETGVARDDGGQYNR
jgi:integrase